MQDYFGRLYTDQSVRIVVIKGAGRAFSAGLDLKHRDNSSYVGSSGVVAGLRSQRAISEIVMKMRRCPQAIISLVHGPACGGGFAFTLASDIRIAGESARMNAAFIRIDLSACDIGVSFFLPRLVGASVVSELMLPAASSMPNAHCASVSFRKSSPTTNWKKPHDPISTKC